MRCRYVRVIEHGAQCRDTLCGGQAPDANEFGLNHGPRRRVGRAIEGRQRAAGADLTEGFCRRRPDKFVLRRQKRRERSHGIGEATVAHGLNQSQASAIGRFAQCA